MIRPRLQNRHAIHVTDSTRRRSLAQRTNSNQFKRSANERYVADYTILNKYASYPYALYAPMVVAGFIRQIRALAVPTDIVTLCERYAVIEEDGILQIGFEVSRILSELSETKDISFVFGKFSGVQLLRLMEHHIKGFAAMDQAQLMAFGQKLIRLKYIRSIAGHDTQFCNSRKYIYEYSQRKTRLFDDFLRRQTVYDRMAWAVGTVIEVLDREQWRTGQIISINKKKQLTVVFSDASGQLMMKHLDLLSSTQVRSTRRFADGRSAWMQGTEIEIYSRSKHRWFAGRIREVLVPNVQRSYVDQVEVEYVADGRECSKVLDRWSCDVRNRADDDEAVMCNGQRLRSGTPLCVWSKSRNEWMAGHVKAAIHTCGCVLVKYGASEKLLSVTSGEIRIGAAALRV